MTDAPAALALAPTLSACGGSGDHGGGAEGSGGAVAVPTWSADPDTERLRHIADLLLTYELVDDEEFDVSTVTGG
ncbi:MAG: hypothetical protein JWR62_3471 [Modestobacter sp.]|jgi:hypothetical protein|nr:hypothetical protein [Modestobacter sp.]